MPIILASASPRRVELLSRVFACFDVVPSGASEASEGTPELRALAAAQAKVHAVGATHSGVVIGADTIVVAGETILGKPGSSEEARAMLELLSGREHEVITGVCVLRTDSRTERTAVEHTTVRFRTLLPAEIDAYLASGEYADKAGAYGIQGRAAAFVDRICGDYSNVIGLPLSRLVLLLREVGVAV